MISKYIDDGDARAKMAMLSIISTLAYWPRIKILEGLITRFDKKLDGLEFDFSAKHKEDIREFMKDHGLYNTRFIPNNEKSGNL